ncbi:MAG: phosphotyrosine protein phosphatase [Lachnospiraceae bacterium]|uniref:Phosphotyrosine protein phosphatase n=1 Tax=Candidatus Weimeria bifida TaxID=2599074 RepID=A0A6N7J1K4_9FIRM|nr:phosphotyrosine protein phosphatase [Candidatus Weimeria bifida]RRF95270.1 MAG: phosphotyrosine protein phosphatase [Lachnospiraceae bacterium]
MRVVRLIFVDKKGNARSAMACALYKKMYEDSGIEAMARGLVVSFGEPLNQKAEAVMVGKGLDTTGFISQQLSEKDIKPGTLIFTMKESDQKRIIAEYSGANERNTFVLSSFVGEELEIMDPYGGSLQVYGICLEALGSTLKKLPEKLKEIENER